MGMVWQAELINLSFWGGAVRVILSNCCIYSLGVTCEVLGAAPGREVYDVSR